MPMPKGWGAEQETGLPLLARVPVSADGTFEARGFPPGAYRLGATLPGFAPHYVDVSAPAEDLRLVFERAASLEVALRDAAGAPLAEAWVTVGIEGRSVDASRRTEEDGSVRFEGLPPGRAHVVPVQGGGVTRWEKFPPHATVDLVAGATAQVDLRALERHAITLRVRDSSGTAVEGADVELKPRGGWSIVVQGEWERVVGSPGGTGGGWKGVTGTDGTAAIDLYAGAYAVTVRREGVARAIVVQVPDREGTIEVRWSSGSAVLGGRLTEDGTGLAVAGRTVWVTSQREGEEREVLARTATDEQGRFEAGGLPAGAVRVDLLLRSRGPEAASDEASPYPTMSWETTLSPSSPTTRDISVPRVRGEGAGPTDVELTLRVLEAGGKPLAGVAWAATAERGGIAISLPAPPQTGADGRAIARVLAADRYRIFVVRRGPGGAALSEPFETEVTPVRGRAEVTATLQPLKRVER